MVWGIVVYWWLSMALWFKPIKRVMIEHRRGPCTSMFWLGVSPVILPLTFLAGMVGLLGCFLFGGREFTRDFIRRFHANYEKAKQERLEQTHGAVHEEG